MKQIGKQTWQFQTVYLNTTGTVVGPKEAQGPLSQTFDDAYSDLYCGEQTWELAERRLMEGAIETTLHKAKKTKDDVDLFIAGDLLDQNVTANYAARQFQIPFLCMFGACSTSMETLAVASALIEGNFAQSAIAATSSHNCTSERQFRFPTEYGVQKPGTMTSTVTGAGAALVSHEKSSVQITGATIGKVFDWGINNPMDMGSAMAPAAADTIYQHLEDTGRQPDDFDLIVTGDLSSVGSPILKDLLREKNIDIGPFHQDCGLMMYRPDQNVFAGGSGTACSAIVTYGHLLQLLQQQSVQRVFVVATGTLMSPTVMQQKETMPTIAHGVVLEAAGGGA